MPPWLRHTPMTRDAVAGRLQLLARKTMYSKRYSISLALILIGATAAAHGWALWDGLFFDGPSAAPLGEDAAGPYAVPLEMVRLAPSASNKQPWRIVRIGRDWHFFLERTPGYWGRSKRLAKIADLQRVDIGIAMCHFALAAQEVGLQGEWVVADPDLELGGRPLEYRATWSD